MRTEPITSQQYQRNLILHLVDRLFIYVGDNIFIFSKEILIGLLRNLGVSPSLMGLTFGLSRFSFLATPLTSRWIESKPYKKNFLLIVGLGFRIPSLAIALALSLGRSGPSWLIPVVAMGGYWTYVLTNSIVAPAEMDLWGDTILKKSRFFSYKIMLSGLVGTGLAVAVSQLFESHSFPRAYILLFWITFATSIISWLVFTQVLDNPAKKAPQRCSFSLGRYLWSAAKLVRQDKALSTFLAGRITNEITVAFLFLVTLEYLRRFQLDDAALANVLFFRFAPAVLIAFLAGRFSERFGPRRSLVGGAAALVAMYFLAIVLQSPTAYLLVFFFMTLHLTIWSACEPDAFLEIAPVDSRVAYNLLTTVIPHTTGAITAPLAGLVAVNAGYNLAFLLALISAVVSLGFYILLASLTLPGPSMAIGEPAEVGATSPARAESV